jgi:hypothetical protein
LLRPILEAASRDLPAPTEQQLADDVARHEMVPLFDGDAFERI